MQTNSKLPFFSIVIPALNEEKYLPNLLSDLTKQTFSDFEVIVVDGQSEDKTRQKALSFAKKLDLQIIESEKRNVSYQRNLGAKYAKADWIIFFDADNRLPNYFLQGIKFHCEMLPTNLITTYINPDTNNKKDAAITKIINIVFELTKNSPNPSVVESMIAIRKNVFFDLKGFDENIHWGEGIDLLSRMKKKKLRFDLVKEPRYTYSLRRLRKQSFFSILRNIAEQELAKMAKIRLPKEYQQKLYPLEGGKFYEIDSKSNTRIKDIFKKIIELEPPKDNKKQPKISIGRIFKKILDKHLRGKILTH
jgi:glycosyltransferase involved in cell wall biosynthesis